MTLSIRSGSHPETLEPGAGIATRSLTGEEGPLLLRASSIRNVLRSPLGHDRPGAAALDYCLGRVPARARDEPVPVRLLTPEFRMNSGVTCSIPAIAWRVPQRAWIGMHSEYD